MAGSDTGPPPARRGPRGSGTDTRAHILEAAAEVFVREGFERGSMRAVARAAGVDPALIRHYFDSKAALFIEALRPMSGAQVESLVPSAPPADQLGEWIARLFLGLWDDPVVGPRVLTVLSTVPSSPEVAGLVKGVLIEEVLGAAIAHAGTDHPEWRASAVATQMVGIAWLRYMIRAEPLASAEREVVVALIAPTIQRYITAPLPEAIGSQLTVPPR